MNSKLWRLLNIVFCRKVKREHQKEAPFTNHLKNPSYKFISLIVTQKNKKGGK